MIKFSLPGYISHEPIIKFFYNMQKEHPEYFIENRIIDSAYDCPSHLIWNGGRIMWEYQNCTDIYRLIDSYHNLGLKLRHNCTNMFIQGTLLTDLQSNQYIEYCEYDNDSVVVYTPELASYIKTNYPKYNITWSTTRGDQDINDINRMSKDDFIVLDYNHNHNYSLLAQLKYPQHVEILCAENCISNCPNRKEHYKSMSLVQLRVPNAIESECPYAKSQGLSNFYMDTLRQDHAITNQDIDNLYANYGIERFKLSGRVAPPYFIIEVILYYLIKPQYKDALRQTALNMMYV